MHMSILHGQSTSFQSTGTEEEALLEMKGLLLDGTWLDGLNPDECERMTALVAGRDGMQAA